MYATLACSVLGARVRCLVAGTGSPMLLLHGIPDDADCWSGVMAELTGHCRCYAPDLPGFGLTSLPAGFRVELAAMADWVDHLLETAAVEMPVSLAVHDLGGAYGLAWAIRNPEKLKRLIVFNTSFFSDRRWHTGARILRTPLAGELAMRVLPRRAFAAALRKASNRNLSKAQIEHTLARFGPEARRAALRHYRALDPEAFRAWQDRLPMLAERASVLVIWGMQDPYLPASFAERFATREIRRFEDCGHWPHREAPQRAAAEITAQLLHCAP